MARTFPLATWGQVRHEFLVHLRAVPGARHQALLAVVMLALSGWCTIMIPNLLGRTVDEVQSGNGDIWGIAVRMVMVAVGQAAGHAIGFYLLARISDRVIADLRNNMVGIALGLPLHQAEDAGTGELVSRSTDDVAEVSAAVTETLPILSTATFTVGATFVALTAVDVRLLGVAIVALPVYWLAARRYLQVAPARYATERSWMAERTRRVLEAIHGRDTVRAYRLEDEMHERIAGASSAVVTHGMKARMSMLVLQLWLTLGDFLLVGGVLVIGFWLVGQDIVSVGAVTGAVLLMIRIRGPIMMLMRVLDTVQSGYASMARIVGVVTDPPLPVVDAGAPSPRGRATMTGVDFSYGPGAGEVRGIDLDIEPGETIAMVGASGAGKSTVAALLMGLRTPAAGQVQLDGVDVTALSDAERISRLAMVSQEVHTFSGTLREDLNLAKEDASDEQLWEVLDRVGARWARGLDCGLDTEVGSRGLRLDPVQAQQVALARVLLMDPVLVVMDEATAEAGSASASVLEEAAAEVARGRSALVVAHRLDQAEQADRVVVMDGGRIIERGSHAELIAQPDGTYVRLWEAWRRGRE